LLLFFLISSTLQILLWAVFFSRFASLQNNSKSIFLEKQPVSVIICSRNEAANLRKNLPKILNQVYFEFELIVVDDASDDETSIILKELSAKNQQLSIVKLQKKEQPGKKTALIKGIEAAKYNWLLLCDADCEPAGKDWISTMMSAVKSDKTEIVLGYGPYKKYPTLINSWIRFETVYTAMQYLSAAIWKIPYMGVGRNLLYKKSVFERHKNALTDNLDLASGDDDLFINAAANSENTEVCVNPKSFVFSEPKHSILALYLQKQRHYSVGTKYKTPNKIVLGIISLSHFSFWLFLIPALLTAPKIAISLFFIRVVILLFVFFKWSNVLNEQNIILKILLFDLCLPLYYVIFAPSLFLKQRKIWK
jgi:glycosyltransferase involved in cell wall biosynthesis